MTDHTPHGDYIRGTHHGNIWTQDEANDLANENERLRGELQWAAFQTDHRRSLHGGYQLLADRLKPFLLP